MITYVVDLAERSYPIHIGSGTLSMLGAELQRLKATRALIVTNTTVGPLYAQKAAASVAQTEIPFSVCELPDGEEFKDLGHLNQILTAASQRHRGFGRRCCGGYGRVCRGNLDARYPFYSGPDNTFGTG